MRVGLGDDVIEEQCFGSGVPTTANRRLRSCGMRALGKKREFVALVRKIATDASIIGVAFSLAPTYALRPSVVSASNDGSPPFATQRIECRAGLQSVGLRQSQWRLGLPWIGCRRTQSKSVGRDGSRRWANMRRICCGRTRSNDRSAGMFAS